MIDYSRRLENFIEINFTNLELKVVFVAPLKMRNLFKFKDKVALPIRSFDEKILIICNLVRLGNNFTNKELNTSKLIS